MKGLLAKLPEGRETFKEVFNFFFLKKENIYLVTLLQDVNRFYI